VILQQGESNPIPFQQQQFRGKVELPLTEDVRFFIFRKMVWNYSKLVISHDDYKLLARPKKEATGVVCVFGAAGTALYQMFLA